MGTVDVSFSGRPGAVVVAVAWLEDKILCGDSIKIGCWLSSHSPEYLKGVSQKRMSERLGISWARIGKCLEEMEAHGILTRTVENPGHPPTHRVVIEFDLGKWTGGRGIASDARGIASHARGVSRDTRTTKVSQDLEEITTRDALFELLWQSYPNKNAKKPARAVWHKMSNVDRALAIDNLPAWLKNRDPKFAPYLQRWLRDRRWEDEPALPASLRPRFKGESPERPPGVHPSAKWVGGKWVQPF